MRLCDEVETTMQANTLDDSSSRHDNDSEIMVNTALLVSIEMLEGA